MKFVKPFSKILATPCVYRVFRTTIGTDELWRTYLKEYVKPIAGEKVLDIGCGPAEVLHYLPNGDYTGIDISREYIESARNRFGAGKRFLYEDASKSSLKREEGTFDLALATGVIHHLTDEEAG